MKPRTLSAILALSSAFVLASSACKRDQGSKLPPPPAVAAHVEHIMITVTDAGFEPGKVAVKQGQTATLVFTRKSDQTCAKEVVFKIEGVPEIREALPLNQPVEVAVTFPKAGEIRYACGMDMVYGIVTVQ